MTRTFQLGIQKHDTVQGVTFKIKKVKVLNICIFNEKVTLNYQFSNLKLE